MRCCISCSTLRHADHPQLPSHSSPGLVARAVNNPLTPSPGAPGGAAWKSSGKVSVSSQDESEPESNCAELELENTSDSESQASCESKCDTKSVAEAKSDAVGEHVHMPPESRSAPAAIGVAPGLRFSQSTQVRPGSLTITTPRQSAVRPPGNLSMVSNKMNPQQERVQSDLSLA